MTSRSALIEAASGPDDLFGSDAGRSYRRLAQLTHPDTHPGDSRTASAFAKLAALWRQHQDGTGVLVARGDIANLHRVSQGLLKVARDPADNDLMRAETIALAELCTRVERPFQAYFPEPVQAQRRRDPGSGAERRPPGLRDRRADRVPQPGRGPGRLSRRDRPPGRHVDVAAPAGRGRHGPPGRAGRAWSKTCWARPSRSGRTGRPWPKSARWPPRYAQALPQPDGEEIRCGSFILRTVASRTIPGRERLTRARAPLSSGRAGGRSVPCSVS